MSDKDRLRKLFKTRLKEQDLITSWNPPKELIEMLIEDIMVEDFIIQDGRFPRCDCNHDKVGVYFFIWTSDLGQNDMFLIRCPICNGWTVDHLGGDK